MRMRTVKRILLSRALGVQLEGRITTPLDKGYISGERLRIPGPRVPSTHLTSSLVCLCVCVCVCLSSLSKALFCLHYASSRGLAAEQQSKGLGPCHSPTLLSGLLGRLGRLCA